MTEADLDHDLRNDEAPTTGEEPPTPPSHRHVENRTIVFPEQRVLYVPVPKAGCTAILWGLVTAAGLDSEGFYNSFSREVSRSLTIHDLGRWPDEFLFAKLPEEQKTEILGADDWFRFTVVRNPFRRIWSAWQSKILLREPQFVEKFASQPWLPDSIDSAEDIIKMFRVFIESIVEDPDLAHADVHWAPQKTLIGGGRVPFTHVGTIEAVEQTTAAVTAHFDSLGAAAPPPLVRANPAPLPYTKHLFEAEQVHALAQVFEEDLREFGYEAPSTSDGDDMPASWIEAVDASLGAMKIIRQRNERVGDLQRVFVRTRRELNNTIADERRRVKRLEQRVRELQARLTDAKNDLARIRNSASWRYTAFLRDASGAARKAVSRLQK